LEIRPSGPYIASHPVQVMVSAHTSTYAEPFDTDVTRWRQITPLEVQRRLPVEEKGTTCVVGALMETVDDVIGAALAGRETATVLRTMAHVDAKPRRTDFIRT